jgi:lysozyme
MAFQDIEQTVVPFTEGWETFSPSPIYDVNGYEIGYGNHYYEDGTAVTADDDPITQPRAEQLMIYFLNQAANQVLSQVRVPLTNNQLAALTDFAYNVGSITPVLLSVINSGAAPDQVAAQMEQSATTSGGVANPNLIARRQAEAGLYQQSGGDSTTLIAIGAAIIILLLLLHRN